MVKMWLSRAPALWSEAPKGCFDPHPKTREICQVKPPHKIHKRMHPNHVQLECWQRGVKPRKKACPNCLGSHAPSCVSRVERSRVFLRDGTYIFIDPRPGKPPTLGFGVQAIIHTTRRKTR